MEEMLIVYVDDQYELTLCDTIAKIEGVATVFALEGRDPDYIIVAKPFMGQKVADDVRTLLGVRLVNTREVLVRQDRNIIDVSDIPGPLPSSQPKMRVAQPVITSADIPGPRPAMRAAARVPRGISTQAGLASFVGGPCDTEVAGLGNLPAYKGFGSGLSTLSEMLE